MLENINGFEILDYNIYGIPVKAKSHICPVCSHERKKNKDKCMSVYWDTGLGQCNHCGETIQLHTYKKKQEIKAYTKPNNSYLEKDYSKKMLAYIESRKIDLSVLKRFKITESKEWMPQTKKDENCICFNYFLENELVNIKYRDGKKNFKLFKGAERIFYNLDRIATSKECIIVEGEFDVLAYATAGFNNVVSVPNGFNLKGDNINLDYLDNYTEYFDNKEVIYIAVDNDDAGIKGQKELVRRLGSERCKLVNFQECKDANDYLIKYGVEGLKETISKAKDIRIEGVFTVDDVRVSMINSYKNGQNRGTTTYVKCIDKAWTWRGGEVNLWTGYQNEGKSLLLNQFCTIRAKYEDAKVAVFSPENMPLDDFYNDIIEMYIGKSCDPYYTNNYMCEDEFNKGLEFCENNFFLIHPEKDFKIQTIFDRVKYLIKKKGIRTLIIDPYNTIEHLIKPGEREDLYISRFMAELKRFAVTYDISINLVAHQITAKANEKDGGRYYKPTLNNIKGGGTFADKADNVLIVWRPNRALDFKDREVLFASQKIKKQKLVGIPQDVDDIMFDIRKNRYEFQGEKPLEDKKAEKEVLPVMSLSDNLWDNDQTDSLCPF